MLNSIYKRTLLSIFDIIATLIDKNYFFNFKNIYDAHLSLFFIN